jgi:hypothetical protein
MSKHPLEEKWGTTAGDILSAIEHGFRAQADVKGKLAELYLYRRLLQLADQAAIENLVWQDKDGKPDFLVTLGGRELRIECKNVRTPQGTKGMVVPRVELQKTRNSKEPLEPTRGYKPEEFDVLGACLFNFTGKWEFVFIATRQLARRPKPQDRFLQIMQSVPLQADGIWRYDPLDALKDSIG